ncbi:hypothetical protein EDD85DRAFT_1024792 [Armillaria nabsnona]|nr:hypothetical protein EDD85DRAFT_1024792 [Armillaria nabsnona]
MKATVNVLDADGKNAVRLSKLKAGQDPMKLVPRNGGDLFLNGGSLSATEYWTSLDKDSEDVDNVSSAPSAASSRTKKRKSDSSDKEPSSKVSRRAYDSQVTVSARRALDVIDENGFARNLPNDELARIQCATDAMRVLSSPSLRSHALVTLIDRDRLQLYQDRDKRNHVNLFSGLKMTLETSDKSKVILVLRDVIHRQKGIIGRDTFVVPARSSAWPDRELAVKISWPSIHRDSEKKLMDAAKAKGDEMTGEGKKHWVLDHLPEIFHSQDFRFNDKETSQRRLVELLNEAEYADRKTFIYEEHLLRITVSERLFPLTDLTDVKDIAQVFFDIFRCHHWLYENPKILHRDMSLNNMMYRKRSNSKGKICILGVLNDFDLSSALPLKEGASLHRIGTPPYMAYDLLGQSDGGHLYRHDIEAFYYVLLMLCCRFEIVQSREGKVMRELQLEKAEMPFAQWFDRTKS